MVVEKTGNIFDSKCNTLVNPVNCVGVMGKGLALEFKQRYPDMFRKYKLLCRYNLLKPGFPAVYQITDDINVILFPTKQSWREPSQLQYIASGLDWLLLNWYRYNFINSIAFPALGCGNGGLDWDVVEPVMVETLNQLPYYVEIYKPQENSNG